MSQKLTLAAATVTDRRDAIVRLIVVAETFTASDGNIDPLEI